MKNNRYSLFLDDFRYPKDAFNYTKNTVYLKEQWVIVRSYEEFVKCLNENGLPVICSYDHDLAESHYNPDILQENYTEKTGYECAKFMVNYHINHQEQEFPEYLVHSMNPVGKQNIISYINSYKKSMDL